MKKLLLSLALVAAGCGRGHSALVVEHPAIVRVTPLTAETDEKILLKVIAALVQERPLDAPVHVVIVPIDGPYLGITRYDDVSGRYEIQLESRVPEFTLYDTLNHEWAHVAHAALRRPARRGLGSRDGRSLRRHAPHPLRAA